MTHELQSLIESDNDIFFTGEISENQINEIEKILNITLPKKYKAFLRKYGLIIGYGIEILGCGKGTESSLVRETKRNRKFGLPEKFIVIRNADEWIYCLDILNGKVVSWDRNSKNIIQVNDNFDEYLYNEILEAKEYWNK